MPTPIDAMLDAVAWAPVKVEPSPDGSLPHVTHSGDLNVCGVVFRCHQLSDGRRVIDKESLERFFMGPLEGIF
jgi:hypothetical protein